jgi:hypothetical protein
MMFGVITETKQYSSDWPQSVKLIPIGFWSMLLSASDASTVHFPNCTDI